MQYYEVIKDDEYLHEIANEQIAYAEEHPFDCKAAVKEAEALRGVKRETVGPMLRVSGGMLDSMKPYTKFLALVDGNTTKPLQISYTESEVDGGKICQLTIVDNLKQALDEADIKRIASAYLDMNEAKIIETPPNVCVVVLFDDHPDDLFLRN
jgi:hypothetical protein